MLNNRVSCILFKIQVKSDNNRWKMVWFHNLLKQFLIFYDIDFFKIFNAKIYLPNLNKIYAITVSRFYIWVTTHLHTYPNKWRLWDLFGLKWG